MQRLDNNSADFGESEIIAFSCVRNEILRLPYFLEYHRHLGVNRFVFVDNGSTDGTREYLPGQKDCILFFTEDSYASSNCGIDWLNSLLTEYGPNHWVLTLEPDELLVYPMCETVGLAHLTKYLESVGAQAMKTLLIDMYSDKAISETHYRSGEPFLDVCQFFDSDSYYERDVNNIPTRGGPRDRLFWRGYNRDNRSPYLVNVPLVKWRPELSYECGTHIISDTALAPISGAKLHFKFFSDFYTYSEIEAQRKEHWDNATQYQTYWDVLSSDPRLSALYKGSERYMDSNQLVNIGLISAPDDYYGFTGNLPASRNYFQKVIGKILDSFRPTT